MGAARLIRMHEVSNLSVCELRNLMGARLWKYRISLGHAKQTADDSQGYAALLMSWLSLHSTEAIFRPWVTRQLPQFRHRQFRHLVHAD